MEIKWFKQVPRRNRGSSNTIKITFTVRPKGVRLNAALTRQLKEKDVKHVEFGFVDDMFFIRPAEEGFTVSNNPKFASAQVCASAVRIWAIDNKLTGKQIEGVYNEETDMYEFKLPQAKADADTKRAESAN